MTDHPLTNEIVHGEFLPKFCYSEEDLRAAYDKGDANRLEQVIKCIEASLMDAYLYVDYSGAYTIDVEAFLEDLKQAMRPQEDQ